MNEATALDRNTRNRVWFGSLSGSSVEWFDFFLYATAAGLIFNKQFFPTDDPYVSLMISYVTLSITFFVRPIGGVIFAHIGDKVGRKKTLVMTITLMGAATIAIGLLPTYEQAGMLAPILLTLCRVVQGLAIGGEWGGALLLAYEFAPRNRRGLYGAIPQMGISIGMLLSTLAFAIVTSLPGTAFEDWAWRVPFISSILLVLLGLWIRNGLGETPAFKKVHEQGHPPKLPIADTIRDHWRSVLVAAGAKTVETAPFYLFSTFVVAYATTTLSYDRTTILNIVTVAAVICTIMIPLTGRLSDDWGRRRTFILGAVLVGAVTVPFFVLLNVGQVWAAFLAVTLAFGICWPWTTSTIGTMTSEIFDARVRYTGVTLGYQIGACLAGGTMPLLAVWMLRHFNGQWWPIATYIIAIAVLAIIAVLASPMVTRIEADQLRKRGIEPNIDSDVIQAGKART
ncbi:MAG: MFS transporter [Paracoccus sp. (in: a-proteobacteria)]|uniref:MFS transporter n=1 Tax=Paracoccus sp. TaxID=267 RepID=UPI0039E37567